MARSPKGSTKTQPAPDAPSPRYFRSKAALRAWFIRNHDGASELWVGFHKKQPGVRTMTYPEAVDEALCFGWIDGVRKSVDAGRYTNRFTPRKQRSKWSAVNIRRVEQLEAAGRMHPAGRAAFARRDASGAQLYSHERESVEMPAPAAAELRRHKEAWAFFSAQAPSYRRAVAWWIVSAQRDDTKARRLAQLVRDSAEGLRVAPLRRPQKKG